MNINKIMEQVQKMKDLQNNIEVIGEAGAGLVKVYMNGNHDVKQVKISEDLLSENKDIIEDIIAAAINHAVSLVDKKNKSKLSEIIPPGFKLPF